MPLLGRCPGVGGSLDVCPLPDPHYGAASGEATQRLPVIPTSKGVSGREESARDRRSCNEKIIHSIRVAVARVWLATWRGICGRDCYVLWTARGLDCGPLGSTVGRIPAETIAWPRPRRRRVAAPDAIRRGYADVVSTSEEQDLPGRRAVPDSRPEVRIGDREREQAAEHLGRAFGEGRLDLAEYDERVASAYSAKTASDLLHLTADLPLATREHPASSAAPVQRRPRTDRARRRSGADDEPLPAWLRRLWLVYASVVAINLMVWLIIGLSSGLDFPYFWPMWVAGPWGVVLLISTFGARLTHSDR